MTCYHIALTWDKIHFQLRYVFLLLNMSRNYITKVPVKFFVLEELIKNMLYKTQVISDDLLS